MADGMRGGAGRGPVTLDQLIALNDEIVALTRAGVPLERGLRAAGGDLPGRLGAVARTLGDRMSAGESLAEALEHSGAAVPPVYRAVVEAGVLSGRLPDALEGLATYARAYAEARRSILMALWYPFLIVVVASALFLAIVTLVIPRFVASFRMFGLPLNAPLRALGWLGANAWLWAPVLPLALIAVVLIGVVTGRAEAIGWRGAFGALRWVPWVRSLLRGYEAAGFADLLALLIENGLPYPKALVLAGEASGHRGIAASSRTLADAVARGAAPAELLAGRSHFPALLRWQLAGGAQGTELAAVLRQSAALYRATARYRAESLRVFLPTLLLLGIGASTTLLYALTLFVPLTALWNELSTQAP